MDIGRTRCICLMHQELCLFQKTCRMIFSVLLDYILIRISSSHKINVVFEMCIAKHWPAMLRFYHSSKNNYSETQQSQTQKIYPLNYMVNGSSLLFCYYTVNRASLRVAILSPVRPDIAAS